MTRTGGGSRQEAAQRDTWRIFEEVVAAARARRVGMNAAAKKTAAKKSAAKKTARKRS